MKNLLIIVVELKSGEGSSSAAEKIKRALVQGAGAQPSNGVWVYPDGEALYDDYGTLQGPWAV